MVNNDLSLFVFLLKNGFDGSFPLRKLQSLMKINLFFKKLIRKIYDSIRF